MTTTSQARDLFARAHELGEGEARAAFLDEECGDDTELRLEVERLLVKAKKVDSFFEDGMNTTILAEGREPTNLEGEGDRVGPYVLRQRIGEGGFGIVWMAEQVEPISRMVALKVVKAGMDTRQVLARFEAERQALAMMDHPHIAKVLDAGATASGRPFFAMELVKGIPITEFCNDQDYGPRRRLELFRDVCSAVNHAHQKGIIHRDLKPSNVMITLVADEPVVKVIDFGIAKATHTKLTEKTLFTRFEQFLGTPVYMSPEQAAMSGLDIDTRSDIYSLGVLLYELLAGAPPFDQKSLLSAGYDEMRRIIREDEPPRPSTRLTHTRATPLPDSKQKLPVSATALRGELDWIVMKAIEKDRTRRYETANALAADLDRFLTDQPVEAAAPSAVYRFRKFTRRHRAALGTAAAMAALLLAGIATTTWQAVRATKERNRAQAAEALAGQRLEESEAVSKFLSDILKSPRPETVAGGRNARVADLLDEASERLDEVDGISPDRVARLRADLASTYAILGVHEKATELRERVYRYFLDTRGSKAPTTISSKMELAFSYSAIGRFEEAQELREAVLASSLEVLGPRRLLTIRAMVSLSRSYEKAGQYEKALELREEAYQISRDELDEDHPEIFHTTLYLAQSYFRAGRLDEALKLREEALELSRRVFPENHPLKLSARQHLANSYDRAGRRDEALVMREEILEKSRALHGPDHPATRFAILDLARSYTAAGRRDEARALREEEISLSAVATESPEPTEAPPVEAAIGLTNLLADFDRVDSGDRWKAVNDNVMGGRSQGGAEIRDGNLVFAGETVTQGGGFSSIRIEEREEALDLSFADAVKMRVKGDGRTYLFEMRTEASVTPTNAIPYRAEFATRAGEWDEVTIPLEQLKATFHGMDISDQVPQLDKTSIHSFGLMIYDKRDGPFHLEVDWIKAVPGD